MFFAQVAGIQDLFFFFKCCQQTENTKKNGVEMTFSRLLLGWVGRVEGQKEAKMGAEGSFEPPENYELTNICCLCKLVVF